MPDTARPLSIAAPPVLECRNLRKQYHGSLLQRATGHAVLRGINLQLAPGERLGLVGMNGAGKSTLLRVLLGLEEPDAGEVLLHGRTLAWHRAHAPHAWRKHMQVVFQDSHSAVNPRFTVEDILNEPLRVHAPGTPATLRQRCAVLLDMVGLPEDFLSKYPAQCSGGQLQRVCIARALAPEPEVLFLDESVSNLDLLVQARMLDLLDELGRELGLTYLFVSHDLRAVFRLCTRVALLDKGMIAEDLPLGAQAQAHPALLRLLSTLS